MEKGRETSSVVVKKENPIRKAYKYGLEAANTKKIQLRMFRFINGKGLPDTTVVQPSFRKMIGALAGSNDLQPDGDKLNMRLSKMESLRREETVVLFSHIREIIADVRNVHGSVLRFIHVGHDIWDGKKDEFFGVSIFFIDPSKWVYYKVCFVLYLYEVESLNCLFEDTCRLS